MAELQIPVLVVGAPLPIGEVGDALLWTNEAARALAEAVGRGGGIGDALTLVWQVPTADGATYEVAVRRVGR